MDMDNLFGRADAVRQIEPFMGKPLIKVITGVRRCGKSSILLLLAKRLKEAGVSDDRVIFINFEDLDYAELGTGRELYAFIKGKMGAGERHYVFLDEVQEVQGWEKAVNSLLSLGGADIYITGSNSKLLSSELSTYIAGRYVEFQIKPLSFAEFLEFNGMPPVEEGFKSYLRRGGFPAVSVYPYSEAEVQMIVRDVYNSAILRDVVQRNNIRNVELLDRVTKFIFDNTGNLFSAKKIADYFKSQNRRVDIETVYNYLNALEQAFVVKKIRRFDIKGKEILKTQEKYFVCDHSVIYSVMGYRDRFISGILENVVMHEMERRGFTVFVGKLNGAEIDFVGEKQNEKIYLQVCYLLNSQETVEREFSQISLIKDNHPKFVVSMDPFFQDNVDGVRHKFIGDFLLEAW